MDEVTVELEMDARTVKLVRKIAKFIYESVDEVDMQDCGAMAISIIAMVRTSDKRDLARIHRDLDNLSTRLSDFEKAAEVLRIMK